MAVEDIPVDVERFQRGQEDQRQRGQDRQREGLPGHGAASERDGTGEGQCAHSGEAQQRTRSRAADPGHLVRLAHAQRGQGSQAGADRESDAEGGAAGRTRQRQEVRGQGQDGELVQQTRGEQNRAVGRPGSGRTAVRGPHQQVRRPDDQRADDGVRTALLRVPLYRREDGEGDPGQQPRARSGEPQAQQRQHSGRSRGRQNRGQAQHEQGVHVSAQTQQGVHEQVVQTVHRVGVPQRRPQVGQGAPRHVVRHHLVPPYAAAAPDVPQAEGEGEGGGDEREPGPPGAGRGPGRCGRQPNRPCQGSW